jgi:YD repeat-containing protein
MTPSGVCVPPIPPKFVHAPSSTAVCPGGTARFFAEIEHEAGAHYAWTKNGLPVGFDSPVLELPSLSLADDGAQIRVTATDICTGQTGPPATLTVFSDTASCTGGLDGEEAPNGGGDPMRTKYWNNSEFRPPKGFPESRVLLHSGELEVAATDLEVRGRGFDFAWTRLYRSREPRSTSMGVGWTHAYNRHAHPAANGGVVVFNPMSGMDTFMPSTTGCYEAPGRFEELCPGSTGGMTLTFPDGTVWTFAPQDGSPTEGKIVQSSDAFGNSMTFAYDSAGRLTTITGTLGRPITIAYNARSLVSSVTDFAGRSVSYAYYDGIEPGGDLDDLKSETSPPVTGTPTGNDFPLGRTTTYMYTSGFPIGETDHNLTSIADPLGHTFVRFAYSSTDNHSDPAFDRLYRVETDDGSATSVETYAYVALTPDPGSVGVSKTVVKDGSGNVGEYVYDADARLIRVREFNGLAPDPSRFTGDVDNRPQPSPGDPPYFETSLSHNTHGLVTQVVYPEGDSVVHTYDSGNSSVRKRGDVTHETQYPGPKGGDQSQIDLSWSNASPFGTDWSGHGEAHIVHPPGTPPGTWRRISDVRIVHPPGTPPGRGDMATASWRMDNAGAGAASGTHVHPPAGHAAGDLAPHQRRPHRAPARPSEPGAASATSASSTRRERRRERGDPVVLTASVEDEDNAEGCDAGQCRKVSDVRIVRRRARAGTWRHISDVRIVHPPGTPPGTWRLGGGDKDDDSDGTLDYPPDGLRVAAYEKRDYCVQYAESDWEFRVQARDACNNHIRVGGEASRGLGWVDQDDDDDGIDPIDEDLRTLPAPRATTRIDSWAAIVQASRPGDLPFAGFPTSYTDANGRTWTFAYDGQGFLTDAEGPPVVTGTLTGAPQTIHHHWDRNAFGQIVSHTGPDGHVETIEYEATGPATGYPSKFTWTVTPTMVEDNYVFDAVGRLTQVTDPNGHTTTFTITADDDVVRVTSPAPFAYQSDYYYDAADRLFREDAQNLDETGAPRANHHASVRHDYDGLGRVIRTSDEMDDDQCSIDEYAWNPEHLLTQVTRPRWSRGTPQLAKEIVYAHHKFDTIFIS